MKLIKNKKLNLAPPPPTKKQYWEGGCYQRVASLIEREVKA